MCQIQAFSVVDIVCLDYGKLMKKTFAEHPNGCLPIPKDLSNLNFNISSDKYLS